MPATADHPRTAALAAQNASDPLDALDDVPSSNDSALRRLSTSRPHEPRTPCAGNRSDWTESLRWCDDQHLDGFPAAPAAVSGYLVFLAGHGAKVGTMSRRISAIKFAHKLRDHPDPTDNARVIAVWEGIRRTHGAPPEQAAPLMPPDLFSVLDACPDIKTWRTPGRPPEPNLAGLRDRTLLLVGFVAALRRSELVALDVDQVADHPNGLVLALPRSKTNQTGQQTELVVLPRAGSPTRCPV